MFFNNVQVWYLNLYRVRGAQGLKGDKHYFLLTSNKNKIKTTLVGNDELAGCAAPSGSLDYVGHVEWIYALILIWEEKR